MYVWPITSLAVESALPQLVRDDDGSNDVLVIEVGRGQADPPADARRSCRRSSRWTNADAEQRLVDAFAHPRPARRLEACDGRIRRRRLPTGDVLHARARHALDQRCRRGRGCRKIVEARLDGDQSIRIRVWQWFEQHPIHDGEDRRRERHAERNHADDRRRIPRRASKGASGVAKVSQHAPIYACESLSRCWSRRWSALVALWQASRVQPSVTTAAFMGT